MANERLKRTPTFSGNRSTHTWSGWIKRNQLGAWERLFSTAGQTLLQLTGSSPPNQIRYLDQTGANYDLRSDILLRDVGSWMHIVLSVDHTKTAPKDRVRIYLNGVEVDFYSTDSSSNGTQNLETFFNSVTEHSLLGRETANSGENFRGEAFDIFWVDGQALTPEVFGFYKDGEGYISAGSTKVTDFRPGQWSPRAPKSIKSEINRRGGFGTNGFYLPMNDSSNPGADFHCDPNSIITLKGEDLPQPRNGLPTTSDNYVSQLRSDPYAANLVLAVPGVNTQPTGSELVTNGTFDSNVSGWTVTDTGTIVRQSDGTAKVTRGSAAEVVYQDITTVVGTTYELSVDITDIAGSHGQVYVRSTDHGGSLSTSIGYSFYTGTYKGTFTADTTTTRIILYAHPSGSTSYDNISVKATTIPDYSADIKGSGTNKTLTATVNCGVRSPNGADGDHVNGYYGSAMQFGNDGTNGSGNTDVINVPTSSDFVFTGDVTMEGWIYPKGTPSTAAIIFGQWLSGGGTNRNFNINFDTSNRVIAYFNSSATNYNTGTSPALALNQWHHVAAEKHGSVFTLYVNGVAVGINANTPTAGNTATVPFTIGSETDGSNGADYGFNGYIQDVRVYKGVAKYKGGFDVPKPYTPLSVESWRAVPDTCKNNFATLNPLLVNPNSTFSDGNLSVTGNQTSGYSHSSTIAVSSGKWYCEMRATQISNMYFGIAADNDGSFNSDSVVYNDALRLRMTGDLHIYLDGSSSPAQSFSSGYSAGSIVAVAFDVDAGTATWYVNGTSVGSYSSGISGKTWAPTLYANTSGEASINFGQNPTFSGQITAGTTYTDSNGRGLFKYQPPAGYLALCEDNLPAPAIADPGKHFKTVVYTGDDSNSKQVSDVGFKPDLIWFKKRTGGSQNHTLFDSVRGAGIRLMPNSDVVEASVTGYLNSFDTNGFSIGGNNFVNDTEDYVAWCWKAGGPAVTNNDGSITSQVSVNQDAGFSIATWSGDGGAGNDIGHGLAKKPSFWIVKRRNVVNDWPVYTDVIDGSLDFLYLNLTNTKGDSSLPISELTSSTIPVGNVNGENYVAYIWTEVENFSKVGTYNGNGLSDGPMIVCGFKPAWVMVKRTDGTGGDWAILNSSMASTNTSTLTALSPNDTRGEGVFGFNADLLSNGFKLRVTDSFSNDSGGTYVFIAFAESPFQTANAK